MAITAAMRTQVTELYVSLFGRAPERDGLAFWVGKLDAGATYAQIAQQMFDVEPARAYYPASSTREELVAKFYSNVLGRTGDAEGVKFWTGKFDAAGKVTVGEVFSQIIAAVKGYTGTDAAALDSKALFLNKVAVGEYYGFTLNSNDVAGATTIMANVTKDPASVEIAKQTNGNNPVLTNGTDKVSGVNFTADLVYTPGGDKRINSLQDEDQLTGTGAVNKLTATLGNANDNGGTVITPKFNNINVLDLTFSGSSSAGNISNNAVTTLDLQDATKVKEVHISRVTSVSNLAAIENIQEALSVMSISNTNANNAGAVEFSFGTDVLKGATSGALNLSNVQVGTVNIGTNTSGITTTPAAGVAGSPGVGVAGYETLALSSNGQSNVVGNLNLPMDTGVDGKLNISGEKNLTLGAITNVVNTGNGTIESVNYSGGVLQAAGRLSEINAEKLTGSLTLNIGNALLTTGKADTSGSVQNVKITGGTNADTFILQDKVEAGDTIDGGAGTDTIIIVGAGTVDNTSNAIASVEKATVLSGATNPTMTVDFSKLPAVDAITVRNVGNTNVAAPTVSAPQTNVGTFNLNNLSAAQANAITIQHANSGSNTITNNVINVGTTTGLTAAGVVTAAPTAQAAVTLTIADGFNTNPRFNAILNSGATSVTIVDADSEDNTIALNTTATTGNSGTLTIGTDKGTGKAGGFINFDTTTNGLGVTNGGIARIDVTGNVILGNGSVSTVQDATATSGANSAIDASLVTTQVRWNGNVDASKELANVTVRLGTGSQNVKMGSGNDIVIFDAIKDTRAGLSISDTLDGGTGNDTLVIDGDMTGAGSLGSNIDLKASEWTNVKGFETIRLVGTSNAAGTAGAGTYSLTLSDALIAANNNGTAAAPGVLAIVNDNDDSAFGSTTNVSSDTATAVESNVTIDAHFLNAVSRFSYNGEEGASQTRDRIIMSDANFNGSHSIDGGATLNTRLPGVTVATANQDVIELRNATNGAIGDFAGISNIGTIELTNDLAITQSSSLQLNTAVVTALSASGRVVIRSVDSTTVAGATIGLSLDGAGMGATAAADVVLGRGVNTVTTGSGSDNIVLLGNYIASTYGANATWDGGTNSTYTIASQANNTAATIVAAGQRNVTDVINAGGGTDTLTTFGAINLAGATLTSVENLIANSDISMTAAQFNALTSITFTGPNSHTLRITDGGSTLTANYLSKITLENAGSLVYDVTGATATAGTVVLKGTGTAGSGTVAANAVGNNGGTAAVSTNVLTNAVDAFNNATAGLENANFGGIAYAKPTLNAATTLTTTQANLTNADTLAFGTATTDTLTFSGAVTGLVINTVANGHVGVTAKVVTGLERVQLDNVPNSVTITDNDVVGFTLTGGSASDAITFTAAATLVAVNTAAGNDNVTLTAKPATVSTFDLGDGDDTFNSATFGSASTHSVNGGNGTDKIVFTDAAAITDAFFTLVSNVEIVNAVGGQTHVLDTLAAIAGIRTLQVANNAATIVQATAAYKAIIGAGGVLTVDSAAMTNTTLTLAAATNGTNLAVTNLVTTLTAANSTGTLAVTLGDAAGDAIAVTTGTGNVTFTGGAATDTVTVTANATALTINAAAAVSKFAYTGTANGQSFTGGTAVDTIASGAFTQTINGGGGVDAITLGAGVQTVVLANAAANADTVAAFTAGSDKLQISKALFTGLTSVVGSGFSVAAEFVSAATTTPVGTGAQFIFNTTDKTLSYDADGTGAGAAVLVATITGVTVTAADFVFVV